VYQKKANLVSTGNGAAIQFEGSSFDEAANQKPGFRL